MKYTATCLFGLEALLGAEIDALGYKRLETIDGRVTFMSDDPACAARCSVNLRFAERLYLEVTRFEVKSFADLFRLVAQIPWEDIIGSRDAFPVKGHSVKSTLYSVPDIQKIIKKAMATRLGNHYHYTTLPEDGTKYQIVFFLLKDVCRIMIDLSGTTLHKRGYRPETVAAPLRETVAAALGEISRPRDNVILRDPFCGSGTIAIEAAMLMKNVAPGANRAHAAEEFPLFPSKTWTEAREEARANIRRDVEFRAFASDIDPECVRIAEESAKRAGVDDIIRFKTMDAMKVTTEGIRGTIVTNPPYGERLMDKEEVEVLYRDMGRAFDRLYKWQMYILTPHERFEELFGKRSDKRKKIYNGMIPCTLYMYYKHLDLQGTYSF